MTSMLFRARIAAWAVALHGATSSRTEWPDEQIVADVAVDLAETQRLDQQENDDQRAIDRMRRWRSASTPRRAAGEPAASQAIRLLIMPGISRMKAGAERAADDAAEAADDDHRQQPRSNVDRELLGRDRVVEA